MARQIAEKLPAAACAFGQPPPRSSPNSRRLRDMEVPVEERRITIDEVFEAHAKGTLDGAAGVGTAAVIAPLGRLRHKDREITVAALTPDSVLARVGAELEGIRSGRIADRHGWLMSL